MFEGIWTLKPNTTALDASASNTSDSVTFPTPLWTISIPTSSFFIFSKLSVKASIEPSESALIIMWRLLTSPSLIWAEIESKVFFLILDSSISLLILCLSFAIFFKSDSF